MNYEVEGLEIVGGSKFKGADGCNVFHETSKERTLEDCIRLSSEEPTEKIGIDVFG